MFKNGNKRVWESITSRGYQGSFQGLQKKIFVFKLNIYDLQLENETFSYEPPWNLLKTLNRHFLSAKLTAFSRAILVYFQPSMISRNCDLPSRVHQSFVLEAALLFFQLNLFARKHTFRKVIFLKRNNRQRLDLQWSGCQKKWPKTLDIIEVIRPNSNQLADTDPEHQARTLQTHKTLKMLFPVF